jgi:hypothetical protein
VSSFVCILSYGRYSWLSKVRFLLPLNEFLANSHLHPGRTHKVKHLWAYMLLGQLVAISAASNLFYLALSRSPSVPSSAPSKSVETRTTPLLYAPLLLSLLTIAISPHTSTETFLPNLLAMHALLVVPLLAYAPVSASQRRPNIRLSTLVAVLTLTNVLIRFRTDVVAAYSVLGRPLPSLPTSFYFPNLPEIITAIKVVLATPVATLTSAIANFLASVASAVWTTLHSHPAQSSIGWDVVWTAASLGVWVFASRDSGEKKDGQGRRRPEERGRGVFIALVGLPGLVSKLTGPWARTPGIPGGQEMKTD